MAATQLDRLLETAVRIGATDIFLRVGKPPTVRVDMRLRALEAAALDARDVQDLLNELTSDQQRENIPPGGATVIGRDHADRARLRIVAVPCDAGWAIDIRVHPTAIRSVASAGLPPITQVLARRSRGLLLISGTSGSGRTTLMRTLLDYIAREIGDRSIVTLERPVELRFSSDMVCLEQREIGVHVPTIAEGIRDARRGGANVIAIGDLQEPADNRAATEASFDGVLILAAVAGLGAASALGQLLIALHDSGVPQPALVLSNAVLGVLSVALCPRKAGGLVPAYELALTTPEISQLIARSRLSELDAIIASGSKYGMQALDAQLFELWRNGVVEEGQVTERARFPSELQFRIDRAKRADDELPPSPDGPGPQPAPIPTRPPNPGLSARADPLQDN